MTRAQSAVVVLTRDDSAENANVLATFIHEFGKLIQDKWKIIILLEISEQVSIVMWLASHIKSFNSD
jgi:DNA-binding HxlR family transcriptional regulator